jgi:hypothetical protein
MKLQAGSHERGGMTIANTTFLDGAFHFCRLGFQELNQLNDEEHHDDQERSARHYDSVFSSA